MDVSDSGVGSDGSVQCFGSPTPPRCPHEMNMPNFFLALMGFLKRIQNMLYNLGHWACVHLHLVTQLLRAHGIKKIKYGMY